MKEYLFAILLATQAVACKESPPPNPVPFTTIENSHYSNYAKPDNLVFKDKQAWENHYIAAHGSNVPEIDFSKEMVLGAYMGMKPTSGYSIEIKKIDEFPGFLEVLVETHNPQPDTMQLQVITHPYHLVKTAKTDKPVTWIYVPAEEKQ